MFKNQSEFSLHLEKLKHDNGFETYTETLTWFYENETDHEMEDIVKMLNQKIINNIQYEAEMRGMLKIDRQVRLF
jgi:hypothetical protein